MNPAPMKKGREMLIKVYIPKQLVPFLTYLEEKLGMGRSEIFVTAFMDYVKDIGLIKDTCQ